MYNLTATLSVFLLILLLNRFKVPLALSILAGSITVGILFRLPLREIPVTLLEGTFQINTLALLTLTTLLLILSKLMQINDTMSRLIENTRNVLKRPAAVMAALPAMIGLLPMPGGAIFSAPMVKEAAEGIEVKGEILSSINYWYRHVWEHCWPLYPGVMLALTLTHSTAGTFALYQAPLGLIMIFSGILIFLKEPGKFFKKTDINKKGGFTGLVKALKPIWIILSVWTALAMCIKFSGISLHPAAARYLPITAGITAAIIASARQGKTGIAQLMKFLKDRKIYEIGALILAVMTFQHMLKHVDAAPGIAAELSAHKVPVMLIMLILPFIAGMVTGLAIGFVGTSFPIILGLLEAMPELGSIRPYIAIAYAFGHLGQMLSPLHLCHIVSNQYFNAPFRAVYPYLLPPAILTGTLSLLYFVILKALLN